MGLEKDQGRLLKSNTLCMRHTHLGQCELDAMHECILCMHACITACCMCILRVGILCIHVGMLCVHMSCLHAC